MTTGRRLSSGVVILIGRGAAQAGLFLFTITPALVLDDARYNDLIVSVTVMLLTVVGPVAAFQQHLVRLPNASTSYRDARSKSLVLAGCCSLLGLLVSLALTGIDDVTILIALGSIVSVLPSLTASLHALGDRFTRSAFTDATSGVLFVLVTIPLVVLGADVVWWAASFLAVWVVAAGITARGAFPSTQVATSLGRFPVVLRQARTMIAIGVAAMAFNRADYLALVVVGTESEAARYALVTRFVGPILIALGSLNNSLYVRQIQLRDDPEVFEQLTIRASRKVGSVALVVAPLSVGAVALLGAVSQTFADFSLIIPTVLLAGATIPFAFAIPFGFALNAQGRERRWLIILLAATALDLVAVVLLGHRGASVTAALWVGTQLLVFAAVRLWWRAPNPSRLNTLTIPK